MYWITCCKIAQLKIKFLQGSAATDLRWDDRFYSSFFSAVHLRMQQWRIIQIGQNWAELNKKCTFKTHNVVIILTSIVTNIFCCLAGFWCSLMMAMLSIQQPLCCIKSMIKVSSFCNKRKKSAVYTHGMVELWTVNRFFKYHLAGQDEWAVLTTLWYGVGLWARTSGLDFRGDLDLASGVFST